MPITEEFVKRLMEPNATLLAPALASKNHPLTRSGAYVSPRAKNRTVRKDTKENTFLSLPLGWNE